MFVMPLGLFILMREGVGWKLLYLVEQLTQLLGQGLKDLGELEPTLEIPNCAEKVDEILNTLVFIGLGLFLLKLLLR